MIDYFLSSLTAVDLIMYALLLGGSFGLLVLVGDLIVERLGAYRRIRDYRRESRRG